MGGLAAGNQMKQVFQWNIEIGIDNWRKERSFAYFHYRAMGSSIGKENRVGSTNKIKVELESK